MAITEKDIKICGHGSGTPSIKNMESYFTLRYNSIASNGKHKGIIKVRRLKALTDAGRKKFHDTYKTLLGRNVYSQNLRAYVYKPYKNKFYSDCSSSGMATFHKIGYDKITLLNTAGIYHSSLFEDVNVKIKNGHITNPEVLKVGDCLLFVGSDPTRPLQIGHVEYVYEINNEKKSAAPAPSPKKTYSGSYPAISSNSSIKKGAKGSNVGKLQKYLNWYFGKNVLKVDNDFGSNTEKYVKLFQKEQKLVVDGKFGNKSLQKAKTVKR